MVLTKIPTFTVVVSTGQDTGSSLVGNDNTSNTGTSSDASKSITQNQTPAPLNEPKTTLPAMPQPLMKIRLLLRTKSLNEQQPVLL